MTSFSSIPSTSTVMPSTILPADFLNMLQQINVPCSDDGFRFLKRDRIAALHGCLAFSPYTCFTHKLALLFIHHDFVPEAPSVLISSHIDALYKHYSVAEEDNERLLGTFDNSLCNAICVSLMREKRFPPNALIAFTGDEEEKSRGVDHVVALLQRKHIYQPLQCVVVTDVTAEYYACAHATLENFFFESRPNKHSVLRFKTREHWQQYLAGVTKDLPFLYHYRQSADPDETWQYNEYDINCVTLGLPCAPPLDTAHEDEWMHHDRGFYVQRSAIVGYTSILQEISCRLVTDLMMHTKFKQHLQPDYPHSG